MNGTAVKNQNCPKTVGAGSQKAAVGPFYPCRYPAYLCGGSSVSPPFLLPRSILHPSHCPAAYPVGRLPLVTSHTPTCLLSG